MSLQLNGTTGVIGPVNEGLVTATGSTTARNLDDRFADVINVKDFGAVGDGVADDRTALTNAIATGKPVYLPPGTYKIEYNVTNCFTLPANTIIYGDGNEATKLLFVASGAAIPYSELFKTAGENITIKDITIETTEVLTQQIVAIRCVNSFVTLKNVKVNGNVTDNGVATNSIVYAFAVSNSGTQNDIKFDGCQFCNLAFVFLKTNASTAINKRLSFLNCDFYQNYGEDISLNSPNGEISEFFVIGNNFYNPNNLLNDKIAIGTASCNNGIIDSNIISGEYGISQLGAIHIEENSQFITVTNNSIAINGSAATGIIALWNNVSGTGYAPKNISITNNVLNYSGTMVGSNSRGIQLNDNIGGDPDNIVISSNVVKNFEIGITLGANNNENIIISENVIDGSGSGIITSGGGINITNNSTSNCNVGIKNSGGGTTTVYEHTFIRCTTNYNTLTGLRPIVLVNPAFEFALFNSTAGSNNDLNIGSLSTNDRCYGQFILTGSTTTDASSVSIKSSLVSWDGATFSATTQTNYEPGSMVIVPIQSSSTLKIRVFTASALSNIRVQAKVNGVISMDL
jgi:hypothetical protein